jgi:hypothetical protein
MKSETAGRWSSSCKVTWLVLAGVFCPLWGAATLLRVTPPRHVFYDYVQEWTSVRNLFSGRPIYMSMNESIPLHFGPDARALLLDVNAHPPASILLSLPFGLLGYREAHLAWNIVSLVMLAVSVWLIIRPTGLDLSPWMVLPMATFLLTSNSLAQQINHGQFNLVLLLLITGSWLANRSGREEAAGLLLGIAAAIKLFPAFLAVYFIAQRRWRSLAICGLSFLAINGLAAAIFGGDCYRTYWQEIVPKVNQGFRDFWPNASLNGYWCKLFDAPNGHVIPLVKCPSVYRIATLVSSCVVVALVLWKCRSARTLAQRDLAFGACVLAMLLVSPITWDHYFLMLLLSWAILWKHMEPHPANRALVLSSVLLLATIYPKWIWHLTIPGPGELVLDPNVKPSVAAPLHVLTVVSYQFYALLGLFLFAVSRRPVPESPAVGAAAPTRDGAAGVARVRRGLAGLVFSREKMRL